MRNVRPLLSFSVAILVIFIQPLYATVRTSFFSVPLRPISPSYRETGHSFYTDRYGSTTTDTNLLLIFDFRSPLLGMPTEGERLPEGVAILVTAPRNDPTGAVAVATALDEIPARTPRIYVSYGDKTRWRLSVPRFAAPQWLTRAIVTNSPAPVHVAYVNAARLGVGEEDIELAETLSRGVPSARLFVPSISALVDAIAPLPKALMETRRRSGATNYLLLPRQEGPLVIPEQILVWSIVAVALILLAFATTRPKRVGRYTHAIRHNGGPLLRLFFVLASSLYGGNIAIRSLSLIVPVYNFPLVMMGGKIAIAFLILSFVYPHLHLHMRRASAVYSGTALLLLFSGAIISSTVSVILGSYFVIAFIFGVLFSNVRSAWLKAFFLAAATIPFFYLVVELSRNAPRSVAVVLLSPPLGREIVTSVLLLPLLLMLFRLDILTRSVPIVKILASISVVVLLGSATFLVIQMRQPRTLSLRAEEVVRAGQSRLTVATDPPRQLSSLLSIRADDTPPITVRGVPFVENRQREPLGTVELTHRTALDRHTIVLSLTTLHPLDEISFTIATSRDVELYATSLPSREPLGTVGRTFHLVPGPLPTQSLSIEIVLRPTQPASFPTVARVTSSAAFTRQGQSEPTEVLSHLSISSVDVRTIWEEQVEVTLQ